MTNRSPSETERLFGLAVCATAGPVALDMLTPAERADPAMIALINGSTKALLEHYALPVFHETVTLSAATLVDACRIARKQLP